MYFVVFAWVPSTRSSRLLTNAVVRLSFAFFPRAQRGRDGQFLIWIFLIFMCRGNRKRDVTTMVTYSHASTPLGQSERAYCLSYFIKRVSCPCCADKWYLPTKWSNSCRLLQSFAFLCCRAKFNSVFLCQGKPSQSVLFTSCKMCCGQTNVVLEWKHFSNRDFFKMNSEFWQRSKASSSRIIGPW